jgi:hypothetical protein
VITFIWGITMCFLLPDTIQSCTFLTEEEKAFAHRRVILHGTGKLDPLHTGKWKVHQVREAALDPKTWLFMAIYGLTQVANGGLQNFGSLVLNGFGFDPLEVVLVGIPAHFIAGGAIFAGGWLSGRYKNITTWLIAGVLIPPVIGSSIIYSLEGKAVRLFAYYLLMTAYASNPLTLGLIATNVKGATKKMTVTALLFLGYCAGNIAGPQFFRSDEAPKYPMGFRAVLISYALSILAALALRIYLVWQNRSRTLIQGAEGSRMDGGGVLLGEDEDITDYETRNFVYRL